jgi:hypothetical protein
MGSDDFVEKEGREKLSEKELLEKESLFRMKRRGNATFLCLLLNIKSFKSEVDIDV